MNDFQIAVLFYVSLQLASLAMLPKWWRLAAIPALLAAPGIFFHDGYMGEVFAGAAMIYAGAYLVVVWGVVGVAKLIGLLLKRRRAKDEI